jgi:hypothetical protein
MEELGFAVARGLNEGMRGEGGQSREKGMFRSSETAKHRIWLERASGQ